MPASAHVSDVRLNPVRYNAMIIPPCLSLAVIVNQPTSVWLPLQVDGPKAVRVANCRCLRFGERAVNRCGHSPKAGGPAIERRERAPWRGVAVTHVHLD